MSRAYPSEIAVSLPYGETSSQGQPASRSSYARATSIGLHSSNLQLSEGHPWVLTWRLRDLQECLNVGPKDAMRIVAILEMQGYVRRREKRR
jgi:hypothetical protein